MMKTQEPSAQESSTLKDVWVWGLSLLFPPWPPIYHLGLPWHL